MHFCGSFQSKKSWTAICKGTDTHFLEKYTIRSLLLQKKKKAWAIPPTCLDILHQSQNAQQKKGPNTLIWTKHKRNWTWGCPVYLQLLHADNHYLICLYYVNWHASRNRVVLSLNTILAAKNLSSKFWKDLIPTWVLLCLELSHNATISICNFEI